MKTKEEILKEITKGMLNINEGSPLHDAMMKAMEEYTQQQVKLFRQPATINSVYECKVCGKPFDNKLSLYEHYDEEHNKQTDL